ncbi:isoamyl acetate-hydrolyzing esterase [Podochytrium sp. JEL0797]|nr:isoamyl acetate-hydrolyzing esterase [Podochytrium sp. JEL0797]
MRFVLQFSFNSDLMGWGAILADKYTHKLDVVNRGFSGFNTEWCKPLLSSTLKSVLPVSSGDRLPTIRIMTLFLGANDAVDPKFNQRHGVPLPHYKKNLHEMLSIVRRESPETKVILITPPPTNPNVWAEVCVEKGKIPDRDAKRTLLYRDACIEVYEEAKDAWGSDLLLLETWEVFFGPGKTDYAMEEVRELLFDGLHLGVKGNKLLGHAILSAIKEAWPELRPDIE